MANLIKPKKQGDWIWIIDSSIQMGSMKCVLILGVNMDNIRHEKDYTLAHSDIEPLVLKTVKSCPGEVIKDALLEARRQTGGSIAVLSDEGSDIKRGVRLYAQDHPVIHSNDILHKMDLLLKKELEGDDIWKNFTKNTTDTIQQLKLTSSAHLVPPKQRQKKRLRGEITLIIWGRKLKRYLKKGHPNGLEKLKLSWILGYESILNAYQEIGDIFDMTVSEVREKGYYKGISEIIKARGLKISVTKRGRCFLEKAIKTLKEEEEKVPAGMRLLGSSEIIETMFGKFKQLEKNHSSGGLTSLVLSIAAMAGELNVSQISEVMERVSINDVNKWKEDNLGETYWSKRRKDMGDNSYQPSCEEDYLDLDEEINTLCA